MSQSNWLKKYLTMKPQVKTIFGDLDEFLSFCKKFGYVYNEANLYKNSSSEYREFLKYRSSGQATDVWQRDIALTKGH